MYLFFGRFALFNIFQTAAKDWHIARGSSWRLHARKTVGDSASTNKIAENKMKPKAKAKAKAKARPVVGSHSALPEVDAPKSRPKAKSKPKAKVVRESNIEEKVAMKGKRANKSGGDAVLGAASSSGGSQGEERSLLGMLPDEMDPLTLVAALKKQYQPPSSSAVAVEHSESKGTADTGHAMGSSMGRNSPSKKKKKQANKLAAEDITDIFGKTEQLGELGGELSDLLDIQHPDDISEEELERVLRELDARMSAGEELGNGWDELDSRSLSLSPEDEAAAAKIIAELGLGNWDMPGIDGYGEEDGVEEEQQAQSKTPRRQQGAAVRGLGDSGSENSENTDGNKEVASSISMPRTAAASRSNAPADSSGDADASDDDKSGDVVIAGVKMRGKVRIVSVGRFHIEPTARRSASQVCFCAHPYCIFVFPPGSLNSIVDGRHLIHCFLTSFHASKLASNVVLRRDPMWMVGCGSGRGPSPCGGVQALDGSPGSRLHV